MILTANHIFSPPVISNFYKVADMDAIWIARQINSRFYRIFTAMRIQIFEYCRCGRHISKALCHLNIIDKDKNHYCSFNYSARFTSFDLSFKQISAVIYYTHLYFHNEPNKIDNIIRCALEAKTYNILNIIDDGLSSPNIAKFIATNIDHIKNINEISENVQFPLHDILCYVADDSEYLNYLLNSCIFRRETIIKAYVKLSHQCVIKIYDYGDIRSSHIAIAIQKTIEPYSLIYCALLINWQCLL